MLLVCYNLLLVNSENTLGNKDTSDLAKKAAEVTRKKEQ